MRTQQFLRAAWAVCLAVLILVPGDVLFARPGGGGGGGRPGGGGGLGGVGGGGARPSPNMGGGGGGARPSPNIGGGGGARPNPNFGGGGGGMPANINRPSVPNVSRPAPVTPSISRPSPNLPNNNVSRPSIPNLGGGNRPSTLPAKPNLPNTGNVGMGNVGKNPAIKLPGDFKPAKPNPPISTKPNLPGSGNVANRPNIPGNVTKPNLPGTGTTRPNLPDIGVTKPAIPNKPDRPSIGQIDRPTTLPARPGDLDRPSTLPTRPLPDRPVIGGGGNNRPGNRPVDPGFDIGRPGNRPGGNNNVDAGWAINRPGGINVNRPGNNLNIGNINNINNNNISNNITNINNNFNRPGWGYGNSPGYNNRPWNDNHWCDHWYDHNVNGHYHGWYNGCWNGHWGSSWYTPIVWGAYGYGAGAWWTSNTWGYGPSYYNPYYDTAALTGYNYSQPVVVNNYVTTDDTGAQVAAPQTTQDDQAMSQFDDGMAAFKSQNYSQALVKFNNALQLMPNDAVLHEVRALTLFALGRYGESAAALNSLLASSPGMNWTSMSAIYGNDVDTYTAQLRKLEDHVRSTPNDAPAIFVLAYHYLVVGQNDSAIRALQVVVKLQPKDATARQMLKALSPPAAAPTETPMPPATSETPAVPEAPGEAPAAEPAAPSTDLVGKWLAKNDQVEVEMTVSDANDFTWKAAPSGQPAVEVKGKIAATADSLALESPEQGTMVGTVKSGGEDQFTFTMANSEDPGLVFKRVK